MTLAYCTGSVGFLAEKPSFFQGGDRPHYAENGSNPVPGMQNNRRILDPR
jgi:hypothetical protein